MLSHIFIHTHMALVSGADCMEESPPAAMTSLGRGPKPRTRREALLTAGAEHWALREGGR